MPPPVQEARSKGRKFINQQNPASHSGKGKLTAVFDFIDLFAGIGGTRRGFEAAGGRCVFTSEWDRFANQTYKANYLNDHGIAGDISKINASDIPDHDVLVAGFPCQPFSLAGVSKKNSLGRSHGFADKTQGTLFFDIARILAEKRPRAFLLENVRHLQRHDQGKTFAVILETLTKELGYHVSFRVIDAACLVPQHRERIFIVGFADPTDFDWDAISWPENPPALKTVLHQPGETADDPYTVSKSGRTRAAPKYTLSDKLWTYLQSYAEKHRAKGNGFGCSVFGPDDRARTLSARYHKDGSEILIRQHGANPRRLTPRECARLMGFPNDWKIPVSDTQAYKQFGNSVVPPVVERIAKQLGVELATD
ncbi:MAG: DNA (cytosine-5)-methyltransferase 1 [Verrucomicrobiales bacterium]|jgi:DNA (cytosine-5)-methyltransferase 1